MEKIEFVFEQGEHYSQYDDIEVKGYLSVEEMIALINSYAQVYFFTDVENKLTTYNKYNLLGAEMNLIWGIMEFCTNIKVKDEEGNLIIDPNVPLYTELWGYLRESISNYDDFREFLTTEIAQIKSEFDKQNSVDFAIKNLIDNVNSFITKMKEFDLSPENLEKINSMVDTITKKVDQSPIADALADKGRKTRKK